MSQKSHNPTFEQILETLRAHGFDVAPYASSPEAMLVSKFGAGAVLAAARSADAPATFLVRPGLLVKGQVARLLDRGYQKFLKTPEYELPATAGQLQAIHLFSEEVNLLIGAINLYNEALGTTSDQYQYDRLQGREPGQPAPRRPWEVAGEH